MKQLVLNVIRALVDHPDAVRLTSVSGAATHIFELRCHDDDIGKVIGKEGKTVSAIRTLLNAVSSKQGRRAVLEVVE
jgi:uncharacterized protein